MMEGYPGCKTIRSTALTCTRFAKMQVLFWSLYIKKLLSQSHLLNFTENHEENAIKKTPKLQMLSQKCYYEPLLCVPLQLIRISLKKLWKVKKTSIFYGIWIKLVGSFWFLLYILEFQSSNLKILHIIL